MKDTNNNDKKIEKFNSLIQIVDILGNFWNKKMFGGFGIFEGEKMFAFIEKDGTLYFKADDSNRQLFEDESCQIHARMSYYLIDEEILNNNKLIQGLAKSSISISKK